MPDTKKPAPDSIEFHNHPERSLWEAAFTAALRGGMGSSAEFSADAAVRGLRKRLVYLEAPKPGYRKPAQ